MIIERVTYECTVCCMTFDRLHTATRHAQYEHSKDECTQCGEEDLSISSLSTETSDEKATILPPPSFVNEATFNAFSKEQEDDMTLAQSESEATSKKLRRSFSPILTSPSKNETKIGRRGGSAKANLPLPVTRVLWHDGYKYWLTTRPNKMTARTKRVSYQ